MPFLYWKSTQDLFVVFCLYESSPFYRCNFKIDLTHNYIHRQQSLVHMFWSRLLQYCGASIHKCVWKKILGDIWWTTSTPILISFKWQFIVMTWLSSYILRDVTKYVRAYLYNGIPYYLKNYYYFIFLNPLPLRNGTHFHMSVCETKP